MEAALDALNPHGRVINCGSISGYNNAQGYGVKVRFPILFSIRTALTYHIIQNLFSLITKRLSMQGFIVSEHQDLYDEFYSVFPQKLASGEIKYSEQRYEGLEQAGQAILDVQKGNNKAKAVIAVSAE